MSIERDIEQYLLESNGWVKSDLICARFGINQRALRKVGNTPGLCSGFAISSDKGFKHIALATTKEWLQFKHRLRRHAVAELNRVSTLDKRRHNVTKTTKRPAFTRERDTGQGLLFPVSRALPY